MSAVQDYRCTGPDHVGSRATRRELLTVKKIQFLEMGVKGKTLKTRTAGWLCPSCVAKDVHWMLEAYDAPGLRDTLDHPTPPKSALTSGADSATIGLAAGASNG